jgi:hypothetical protein
MPRFRPLCRTPIDVMQSAENALLDDFATAAALTRNVPMASKPGKDGPASEESRKRVILPWVL